jgi:hypothetical protein
MEETKSKLDAALEFMESNQEVQGLSRKEVIPLSLL